MHAPGDERNSYFLLPSTTLYHFSIKISIKMELVFLGLLCVSLFGKHVHLQSIFPQHEEQRGNKAGRQGWSINVFESSVAVKQNLERRRIYGLSSQPIPDIRLTRTVSGWLG